MENQFNETKSTKPETTLHKKNEIGMPLLALGLSLAPFLIGFLISRLGSISSFILLLMVLSPIAGMLVGVSSLKRGKRRIGLTGTIFSIVAITIPLAFILLIIIFFVGAATGMISLM